MLARADKVTNEIGSLPLLALFGHAAMSELSLLSGVNRTSLLRPPTSDFDPKTKRRVYAMTLSVSASIAAGCRGRVVRRLALGHPLKNVGRGGLTLDYGEHACSLLSGTMPRSWGH